MPTVAESIQAAGQRLAEAGIAEARREAASLLAFVLGKDRTFLIAHPEHELTGDEINDFGAFVERRSKHEPFQYITGVQEFFGLDFEVTPDVLIPRPETEMVVEAAIEILGKFGEGVVCEVGIGSGCISVAVLHAVEKAAAVGLDVSPAALAVAKKNARKHGVYRRLQLIESDVFSSISEGPFDLIVSNPPYVPFGDLTGLQAEVRDFEPQEALTDGGSGLSIIERIIDGSPELLKPEGWLLMEIGFSQSPAVKQMFDQKRWASFEFLPDLQGIPRLLRAQAK